MATERVRGGDPEAAGATANPRYPARPAAGDRHQLIGELSWPPAVTAGQGMRTCRYDITQYQPVLFAADGFEQLLDVAGGFFAAPDDDAPARLGAASANA